MGKYDRFALWRSHYVYTHCYHGHLPQIITIFCPDVMHIDYKLHLNDITQTKSMYIIYLYTFSLMASSHILSAVEPSLMSNNSNSSPSHGGGNGGQTTNLHQLTSSHQHSHHGSPMSLNGANDMRLGTPTELMAERNLCVSLDDRELWTRFQNLTNEMIVTKNGR